MHLSAEFEHELDDDELSIRRERNALLIAQQLHARVLAANGEHRVADVSLPVGVGVAQLLGRPHRIVREVGVGYSHQHQGISVHLGRSVLFEQSRL